MITFKLGGLGTPLQSILHMNDCLLLLRRHCDASAELVGIPELESAHWKERKRRQRGRTSSLHTESEIKLYQYDDRQQLQAGQRKHVQENETEKVIESFRMRERGGW